jgi:hypothetical protein
MDVLKFKKKMIAEEAKSLLRLQEKGEKGNEFLMRSIIKDQDFVEGNFPIAFVQYCIKKVDSVCSEVIKDYKSCELEFQNNMIEFWQRIDRRTRKKKPEIGDLVVMHNMKHNKLLTSGQFGIIVEVNKDSSFKTIEGSIISQFEEEAFTSQYAGVRLRERSPKGSSKMRVLGYFSPWIDRQ